MKKTRSFMNSLLVCGVTLAMAYNVTAQTSSRTAKVVRVNGTARYSVNNGTDWNDLTSGTVLKEGSVVQTDQKDTSYVNIVLGEGQAVSLTTVGLNGARTGAGHGAQIDADVLRLHQDTALGIDKLAATSTGAGVQTETQLDLRKGHITGNVKKMVAGSIYEIKYPKGVAGIRGSVFDMALVESVQNGTVTVSCILNMASGSAVLSFVNAQGQTISQTVLPTFSFNTATGILSPIPDSVTQEIAAVLGSMGFTTPVAVTILTGNGNYIDIVTTTAGH